jgi:hypothetical protein
VANFDPDTFFWAEFQGVDTTNLSYRRLVTEGVRRQRLNLRSDTCVGEVYTENNIRRVVVAMERTPVFLGGLGELEDHGRFEGAPTRLVSEATYIPPAFRMPVFRAKGRDASRPCR